MRVCSSAPPRATRCRSSAWSGRTSLTGCYTGPFADWLYEARRWRVEVVRHPARQLWRYGYDEKPTHAFRVLPRRWVVERTFAWLGQARRLSRDYERLPATSEAVIYGAMSRLMLRRLTRAAA